MTIFRYFVLFLGLIFLTPFQAGDAAAQATRTWVSGVGDDANPCSRTAPCKTFAGAISKTAAGGEISVLDPGGFGTLTITKSISIVADGDLGSILAAGTNGVIINAGVNDVVVLSGLEINGVSKSATPGLAGVKVVQAGRVVIRNTLIQNFSVAGVQVEPSAATSRVSIENTSIINSTIGVLSKGGVFAAIATLNRAMLTGNQTAGVRADGAVAYTISSDTIITNSTVAFDVLNGGRNKTFGNNTVSNCGSNGTLQPVTPLL